MKYGRQEKEMPKGNEYSYQGNTRSDRESGKQMFSKKNMSVNHIMSC